MADVLIENIASILDSASKITLYASMMVCTEANIYAPIDLNKNKKEANLSFYRDTLKASIDMIRKLGHTIRTIKNIQQETVDRVSKYKDSIEKWATLYGIPPSCFQKLPFQPF